MKKQFLLMITKVKNEVDIIESFLRYHSFIFDKIVVIENGSFDGTFEIIQALVEEGLNVEVINEAAVNFDDFRMSNKYTEKYVTETDADYVVLMDADEFLISDKNENPRQIIEKLDKNKIYYLKWKTYIYDSIREEEDFIPLKFPVYRDEKGEKFKKIIIPGKLYLNDRLIIKEGNHDFVCDKNIETECLANLKFAHYPVRSKSQYVKQIVLNVIALMSSPKENIQSGAHWKKMYQIHENNVDLYSESLGYAFYEGEKKCYGTIQDLFELKDKLKYQNLQNDNILQLVLEYMEIQALKLKAERLNTIKEKQNREQILVYGVGEFCKRRIDKINIHRYEIVCFVDSNREKQLQIYNNKIIIAPDKMRFFLFDKIIIASDKYENEIREKIKDELPMLPDNKIISIESFIIEEYRNSLL